nr:transposase [Hyphomonas sediminis]
MEAYVTKKREKAAALKFLRKAMKRYGNPEVVVVVSGQTALRRQFQRRNLGKWPKIRFATSRPRLKSSSLA